MSTRVKAGLCLALFVVLQGVYMYYTWDASKVVAQQLIALGPVNWIDFGFGAIIMFFTMMLGFIALTLRETKRFDNEVGGDGGSTDGSGGAPKRVRMPMSRKVIDIRTWQPPQGGQYHRSAVPATS